METWANVTVQELWIHLLSFSSVVVSNLSILKTLIRYRCRVVGGGGGSGGGGGWGGGGRFNSSRQTKTTNKKDVGFSLLRHGFLTETLSK